MTEQHIHDNIDNRSEISEESDEDDIDVFHQEEEKYGL